MRIMKDVSQWNAITRPLMLALVIGLPATAWTQPLPAASSDVTYTKHIAPILQRSCENCHRPGGGAPMSLRTYEEVRPWARRSSSAPAIGPHAGVMPPWYMEKNIGIQRYKDDPSLSAKEVAMIAAWVDSGAPRGNPADAPPAKVWADNSVWRIGTPDLIVKTKDIIVKANSPDWWGEIEPVPIPLDEDRYVAAVEIKEVNDADAHVGGRETVGGLFVWHHLIYRTQVGLETPSPQDLVNGSDNVVNWPVHEVGRNPDYFDPKAAVLLKKGLVHRVRLAAHALERPGHDVAPRVRLQVHAEGLQAGLQALADRARQRRRHRHQGHGGKTSSSMPTRCSTTTRRSFRSSRTCTRRERACVSRRFGATTSRRCSCVGYDHNWVRGYSYADDAAPLLPKGTILHIIGYFDNTPANQECRRSEKLVGIGQPIDHQHVHRPRQPRVDDRRAVPAGDGRARARESWPRRHARVSAVWRRWRSSRRHRRRINRSTNGGTTMTNDWLGWIGGVALLAAGGGANAQSLSYSSGQSVAPATKGGKQDADGAKYFVFGYMNRNWEEELDVPVGPANGFAPGNADPDSRRTFFRRRNRFIFQGQSARHVHREGRTRLDADDERQDQQGVRVACASTTSSTTW